MLSITTKNQISHYSELLGEIAKDYMTDTGMNHDAVYLDQKNQKAEAMLLKERKEATEIGYMLIHCADQMLQGIADSAKEKNNQTSSHAIKQEKRIRKALKSGGMIVYEYSRRRNQNGFEEIHMVLGSEKKEYFETIEVAELLSCVLHRPMLSAWENSPYIYDQPVSVCFEEDTVFAIYHSFAKATKDGECISGDNFLIREFSDGGFIGALSDGAGSGERAAAESEKALSLLERFCESGLSIKQYFTICNGLIYLKRDVLGSITMDVMHVNLYTGEARFYKMGACETFIIRDEEIEKVQSKQSVLGIKKDIRITGSSIFLKQGDVVVMMTDGLWECFEACQEELYTILKKAAAMSPKELATHLLSVAIGISNASLSDDMTVLTYYVMEKDD